MISAPADRPADAEAVPGPAMEGSSMNGIQQSRQRQTGVTLLELMLVVALVAILAIIAVPNYQRYSMRAHRTEAKSALMKLSTNEERYYLQNHAYTLDPANLGFSNSESENGTYALAITTAGGITNDYTATAKPTAGGGTNGVTMVQDTDCQVFTINSAGVRSATPDANGRCW